MSLGKLLSAGKSLVGLTGSNARYQLQKGALPKFESAKNPFATKPAIEREPQLPKLSEEEIAATKLKQTQPLPVLNAQPEKPAEAAAVVAPPEPAKPSPVVDGWVKKLNPMVWFGNRKPAEPKSAIPRFNKAPVQGELSLDNIKVMRNDLSEADVEVVPAKVKPVKMPAAPAVTSSAAAAVAVPDLPPATRAWEFIGEHLLGKH